MKESRYIILATFIGMFIFGITFAQQVGDYRSAGNDGGDWSSTATWEIYDGESWGTPESAPSGSDTISIAGNDTVSIDVAVTITGYVRVSGNAVLDTTSGSLEFNDGSTYEHARNEGSIPVSTWNEGSTFLLTGITTTAPNNRNQNYYNITINTPNLGSNRDLGLDDVIIGGDIHVIESGGSRWRLTSTSSNDTSLITIMGDVIVEGGSLETQGTSNAFTTFIVNHYGDIIVTGGTFAISRGSQGNGTGTTTWNLFGGDFILSDATTRNSNPEPGQARFVFAGVDTQRITFMNYTYGSGDVHWNVSDSSIVEITEVFSVNGLFVNEGEVIARDSLIFLNGSVYEHARNGGEVPAITWDTGSTALFTGIEGTAPGNRGQDYYNLILNTPNLSSNRDMDLADHTISGDITLLNSGGSRWRLVGGDSCTITIMGDVIVVDGSLETQGTSSPSVVEVLHHGNVNVTGGTFAVSRGSQGSVGTTRWYLLEGDFSISDATTRNSNTAGATFVFANAATAQNITLTNVEYGGGGLPIEVANNVTLNFAGNQLGGNGAFILNAQATLITSNSAGLDSTLATSGSITLNDAANYVFNGNEIQSAGQLPDTMATLTIDNQAGVTFNDTTVSSELIVSAGSIMQIDTLGNIKTDDGDISGRIVNHGVIEAENSLLFMPGSFYEHARDEGDIPSGVWSEGSTILLSGIVNTAPGNRNQSYYNLILNTPNLASNRDMGLNNVTIGGDIRVISSGSSRWRLTSASGGDTAIVTIMGDLIVEGGSFETQGTSNALTVFEVHHYGNVIVTGGTFAVSRGSQGDGSGSTRWYMHEGDFSIINATTRNSNPTNAWFVFDKDTIQNISLSNVSYGGGGLPIEVASGTTLSFWRSILRGNGIFVLNDGAAIATAVDGGIDSTLQTTGDITLSNEASFIFNGVIVSQVTGLLMPDTVNGLTINNNGGAILSQETVITGLLRLVSGVFDNTISFTLGENGSISYEGGSLLYPVSDIEIPANEIPTKFALFQNYPNPFNPSTTIRYDVAKLVQVTLKIYDIMGREVAELVNSQHSPGAYSALWNAADFASGLYYYRIEAGDYISVQKLVLIK